MKALPRLTAGLIALCALLAAALALLWLLPNGQGRLRHAWVAPSAQAPALDSLAVPLPSPAPLPLASYAVTLQRPLFTESRRPLPAAGVNAAAQAPAAPDELEKSQLLGLISGPSSSVSWRASTARSAPSGAATTSAPGPCAPFVTAKSCSRRATTSASSSSNTPVAAQTRLRRRRPSVRPRLPLSHPHPPPHERR